MKTPNQGGPKPSNGARRWANGEVRRAIVFVQADEVAPGTGPRAARSYACWMPYQVGQAAKTEQIQAELEAKFPKRAGE